MRKLCCLTVLSAVAVCAVFPGAALGARGTVKVYASGVTGVATRAVDQSASLSPGAAFGSRGARRRPHSASRAAPATALPRAASSGLTASASPLLANFNGTSSRDSAVTNFNQEFEPPDQGLCAGNGFVMDMVNSAYTIYKPHGAVVSGPFNINGPFGEGLTQFTSDPRCYYDPSTNTWFATILFISGGDFGAFGDTSHLDIAVNSPNGPTRSTATRAIPPTRGSSIRSTRLTRAVTAARASAISRGSGSTRRTFTSVVMSSRSTVREFDGGEIYAISKKDLVALKPTVHFVRFPHLSIGGTTPLAPQPALTTGSSSAEYFLGSLDPNGTFDQRLGVWAMTNTSAVSMGAKPTLSSLVLTSEAYGVPPGAEQKGTTSLLDSGDDRMQQTQFINGSVWGELDTALTIPGDSAPRAGAAWFRVRPHLTAGKLDSTTKVLQQGYVAVKGRYFIYPALQVAPDGGAAMVATLSGSNLFPSAAFTTLTPREQCVWPGAGRRDRVHELRPQREPLGRLLVGRDRPKRNVDLAGDGVRPAEVEPDPGWPRELGHAGDERVSALAKRRPSPGRRTGVVWSAARPGCDAWQPPSRWCRFRIGQRQWLARVASRCGGLRSSVRRAWREGSLAVLLLLAHRARLVSASFLSLRSRADPLPGERDGQTRGVRYRAQHQGAHSGARGAAQGP